MSLLIQLQDCDNRIKGIIERKTEGPLRIKKLEDELNNHKMKCQEEYNRLESLRKNRRKIEQEIQDMDIKIEKSDSKLSHIKSNKEYKAALKEIEDLKKGKFQTEDEVIQIMEAIEELEKRAVENKRTQAELGKRFEQDKKEISKELHNLDRELAAIESKRKDFCKNVDQELLGRYHFLKDRKGGQALSSVIGGICQSCYMGIPPQKYNELRKGHSLMICPNCYRIIYWGEDELYKDLG